MTIDIGFISARSRFARAYSAVSAGVLDRSLKKTFLCIPQSATAGFITVPCSPPSQTMNSRLQRSQYFLYAQV